jgi:hypothetical protein
MSKPTYNKSMPPDLAQVGIENRNFLSPIGFLFTINKMRGVEFFCQSASIPSISMGAPIQGTRINKIPQPGDELYYEDLFLRFLVDENMKNWYQVHDWMREITTPYSAKEFTFSRGDIKSINDGDPRKANWMGDWTNQWRSDCSLFILSSNYRPVAEFIFRDAFPVSLTTLNFDAAVPDINYFTAEVVLKYNYYDYFIYDAATATDSTMKANYQRTQNGEYLNYPGVNPADVGEGQQD